MIHICNVSREPARAIFPLDLLLREHAGTTLLELFSGLNSRVVSRLFFKQSLHTSETLALELNYQQMSVNTIWVRFTQVTKGPKLWRNWLSNKTLKLCFALTRTRKLHTHARGPTEVCLE